jgi:pectate lyase
VAATGGHSMASNVTQLERGLPFGRRITFFRNLFTTSNERIPRFQGTQCADVINNVIYDWGIRAGHGNPRSLNMVANLFRSGPDTVSHRFWVAQHSDVAPRLFDGAVWLADNVADGFAVGGPAGDVSVFANAPACPLSIEPEQPRTIYDAILAAVGASRPVRDPVDLRIISNVRERRGGFRNGEGQAAPNPDWPDLAPAQPEADVDADGMPDSWEVQAFGSLDRGDPLDSSGDADGDGWTDLEEWLNDTDPNRTDAVIAPG